MSRPAGPSCRSRPPLPFFVADVVVPISYAAKGRQHAHALAAYKIDVPVEGGPDESPQSAAAFLADHHGCVEKAARVDTWMHVAVVPSTRGRKGEHPLRALAGNHLRAFSWAQLTANATLPAGLRAFRPDPVHRCLRRPQRRTRSAPGRHLDHRGSHPVCLLRLKQAGASRVAPVVLGRHMNPGYEGWKPILDTTKDQPYRQEICAIHG